jgi:phosphate-selective porin OprO/OprP
MITTKRAVLALLVAAAARPASAQIKLDLERLPALATEKPDEDVLQKSRVRFEWKEHPSLRFGKELRIDFRARVQTDSRESDAPLSDDNTDAGGFDIARRRIGVEGAIGKFADFQVERELSNDDPWRDVYLNYSQHTVLQVQGGKFKLPFSLDETTSATNLDFVYRSRIAAQLAPGRDRGVMAHGRLFERRLDYEAGWFVHDGDNARTRSGTRVFAGRTIAVRVAAEPFRPSKSAMEDFHVGVAFTTGEVPEGFTGLRGRTVLDEAFFPSHIYVNGTRRRMGLEFRVRPGPASIKAEMIRVTEERLGQSVEDGDLSPFISRGWYISGSYAITGDSKSKGLDEPKKPFLQGGLGAIEVAARIEQLEFASDGGIGDPSTSPRSDVVQGNTDRAATVGVNWYLNRWVKLQFNVIHEDIADPSRGPLTDRSTFWSRVFRLQLVI